MNRLNDEFQLLWREKQQENSPLPQPDDPFLSARLWEDEKRARKLSDEVIISINLET